MFRTPPSTPLVKRNRTELSTPKIRETPTPFAAGLMGAPLDSSEPNDTPSSVPRRSRKVLPNKTNAPLRTPRGTKVTATNPNPEETSEVFVFGVSQTTTDNLLQRACAHLIETDPKMKPLIDKYHCRVFSPEGLAEEISPFKSLAGGIMGQQISSAAAHSVQGKFVSLFNEGIEESAHVWPGPEQVAATDIARLRTAGLSGRKAEYIKGLAERFASGELDTKMLVEASDQEVLEKLTAVRGLGKWSVEMFACFGLKRTDILSTGDLGVQ